MGLTFALPTLASFPILNLLARKKGLSRLVWALVMVHAIIPIGMSMSFGMPVSAGSSGDVAQETVSFALCRSNLYLHCSGIAQSSYTRCHEWVEPGRSYKLLGRNGTDTLGK